MASVYLKRDTWYLRVRDVSGRWLCKASTATSKTEARKLAADLERRFERQRLGLEPAELVDGGGTVDELMGWWVEKFLRKAGSDTGESSIRKHIIGSPLGRLPLTEVTYPLHGPRTADVNGRRADWGHDERKADDGLRTARMVPVPPAG